MSLETEIQSFFIQENELNKNGNYFATHLGRSLDMESLYMRLEVSFRFNIKKFAVYC